MHPSICPNCSAHDSDDCDPWNPFALPPQSAVLPATEDTDQILESATFVCVGRAVAEAAGEAVPGWSASPIRSPRSPYCACSRGVEAIVDASDVLDDNGGNPSQEHVFLVILQLLVP